MQMDPDIASQAVHGPKPSKHGAKWTKQEIKQLVKLKNAKKSVDEIATKLERTKHGIHTKWQILKTNYAQLQNINSTNSNSRSVPSSPPNTVDTTENKDNDTKAEDDQTENVSQIAPSNHDRMESDHESVKDTLELAIWFYKLLKYFERDPTTGHYIERVNDELICMDKGARISRWSFIWQV